VAIGFGEIAAVAHQAAAGRKIAKHEDGGYSMAEGQCGDPLAAADEEGIVADHQSAGAQPCQASKSLIEVGIAGGLQDGQLQSHGAGRRLQCRALGEAGICRIDQQGDRGRGGDRFAQQLQPLRRNFDVQRGSPR
jgi:hypothetical protein